MLSSRHAPVLDKGYAKLVGMMIDFEDLDAVADFSPGSRGVYLDVVPEDLTLDAQIARAARVSYAEGTKSVRSEAGLIDYLMRHRHTSPFEQVVFKFKLKMPLFVAQQWIRHRTARLNQESARYSVVKDEVYQPTLWRAQDDVNKQGSAGVIAGAAQADFDQERHENVREAFALYHHMLDHGVARELARTHLPVGTYTSMVWQMDLHNLMHFLSLRMDEHAQYEIRLYAQALYDLVQPLAPLAFASFENHVLGAVTFSGDEMALIREVLDYNTDIEDLEAALSERGVNKSRRREFLAKIGVTE